MAFNPPDSNVFYPVPPGQLPPGFVAPPPGTAVRGIPIVVPHGLEMLISPEGFPVFVPERSSAPPPPYLSSPPAIPNSSPSVPSRHNTVSSQHHTLNQYPTPPTRHTTMPAAQTNQYPTPPPPVPALPVAQTPVSLPHQMPLPTDLAGPVMVGLVKTYLGESTGFPRIAYGIRLGVADEKYRCDLGFDHSSIDDGGILGRVGIDPDEFEEITTGTTGVD
ncbi:hypothetical protein BGZ80_003127 [Entomortierella chlamydospora]|uniref:Uncharacterized protein n=1 Tax=Entomortierella chlamydospora TaxID=101097 RepID=A0A9P6SWV4_9FUNG|nr:hypothetical protein BGZ80_003127 [Entomortierella chlamydospora]